MLASPEGGKKTVEHAQRTAAVEASLQSSPARDCSRSSHTAMLARLRLLGSCEALSGGAFAHHDDAKASRIVRFPFSAIGRTQANRSAARHSTARSPKSMLHGIAWHGTWPPYLQWPSVASALRKYEYIMHSSCEQPWLALFLSSGGRKSLPIARSPDSRRRVFASREAAHAHPLRKKNSDERRTMARSVTKRGIILLSLLSERRSTYGVCFSATSTLEITHDSLQHVANLVAVLSLSAFIWVSTELLLQVRYAQRLTPERPLPETTPPPQLASGPRIEIIPADAVTTYCQAILQDLILATS
ncbi:hypothetical protein TRIATDRAFT_271074 [Trichoderma atroviride IMI 206040]|uniref:Uncharacterized protein n=1 Tax=Hypocrea atroviridis (strain ATCC 20476 / IMI 206040) TaxID=452589 RepID=G9NJI0_HYPAI|nr:uncharacterized protein TRIATDRAFT_271074 [Trichoderma atroviride IMI 206040]EHK49053.1 hypothetical protein TRIATDRAFT_271074 [Trichoderma atroviride IMI 206040]